MEKKMPSLINTLKLSLPYIALLIIGLNIFVYFNITENGITDNKIIKILTRDDDTLTRILNKIDILEKNNKEKNISKYQEKLRSNDNFFLGNKEGSTVIVEFFDYNCGYCKRSFPELMDLISDDKNIKVILKELPVLGESSVLAARASIASEKQKKYFSMHQELIKISGQISEVDIINISEKIGINYDQLKIDMNKDETILLINENYRLADLIGVRGTPAFIINNELIPGAIGKEEMVEILKNEK
jgi:protein-disulfide isomerase